MLVVCDVEADSLTPTKLWVVVCKEVDTGVVHIFKRPDINPKEFLEFAEGVTGWIGHNFLGFDLGALHKLVPGFSVTYSRVIDTLVVSRLTNYGIAGGHSLEAWGERMKLPKISFNDFSQLTQEMIDYCVQDVEVNYALFLKLKKYIFSAQWKQAMRIEHETAWMCKELHDNGFAFDETGALKLQEDILRELAELEQQFQEQFPPRFKENREINPRFTAAGGLHLGDFRWCPREELDWYSPGCPFTLIDLVPFDPASKLQVIDRMWEAGWKPTNKTDGHKDYLKNARRNGAEPEKLQRFKRYGWKIDDTNLATLPENAPESAKKLSKWLFLTGRKNQLKGWLDNYNGDTGRIHGKFMHIGSWTHRMAHAAPNMANASSEHEYRALWVADEGKVLVGCDAEGIQLRVLAHYINDPVFTEALISGDKKLGTDAHSLNARALGEVCLKHGDKARDRAKTFIYAFVLGASASKIAEVFECSTGDAEDAVQAFIRAYPGLKLLKERAIPRDAERGYFEGLDGRYVRCSSEHLMLAGYLQNGESSIMKLARILWDKELKERGIWFKFVNLVHDEFQTVCNPEDADTVGQVQAAAIVKAGEMLNCKCPQAGDYRIGLNWSETH